VSPRRPPPPPVDLSLQRRNLGLVGGTGLAGHHRPYRSATRQPLAASRTSLPAAEFDGRHRAGVSFISAGAPRSCRNTSPTDDRAQAAFLALSSPNFAAKFGLAGNENETSFADTGNFAAANRSQRRTPLP